MSSVFAFQTDRAAPGPGVSRAASSRYDPQELLALAWRERGFVAAVFVVLALMGAAAALQLKTLYPAHSSLLVRLGSEYVYDPRVGDAARGAVPENDQVIQSEIEILSSPALKAKVIADIGLDRLFPKLGRAYAHASPARRRAVEGAAIKAMESGLKIVTAPGTSVVRLTYAHPDPQMAATALNTLIDEYLKYRSTVLVAQDANAIGDERQAFQAPAGRGQRGL